MDFPVSPKTSRTSWQTPGDCNNEYFSQAHSGCMAYQSASDELSASEEHEISANSRLGENTPCRSMLDGQNLKPLHISSLAPSGLLRSKIPIALGSKRPLPCLRIATTHMNHGDSTMTDVDEDVLVPSTHRRQASRPPLHITFSPGTKMGPCNSDEKIHEEGIRQDSAATASNPASFASQDDRKRPSVASVSLASSQPPLKQWEQELTLSGTTIRDFAYETPAGVSAPRGRLLSDPELNVLMSVAQSLEPRRVRFEDGTGSEGMHKRRLTTTPAEVARLKQLWAQEKEKAREKEREEDKARKMEKEMDGDIDNGTIRSKLKHAWNRYFPSSCEDSSRLRRKDVREYFHASAERRWSAAITAHGNDTEQGPAPEEKRESASQRERSANVSDEECAIDDSNHEEGQEDGSATPEACSRVLKRGSRGSLDHSERALTSSKTDVAHSEVQQNWHRVQADRIADQLEGWQPLGI